MAGLDAHSDASFDKLRSLLIGDDLKTIDSVVERVAKIDAFVGEAERLENATASILVEAFRKAEIAQHRELAGAVAPLVVAAIRSEIKNSKEMMVEALYPITGRLVAAAVAHAFRDLVEDMNKRIDMLASAGAWRLRLRAIATGKSMAEVAMAEAEAGRLMRALLLERGSGRVLATWPMAAQDGDQAELTSGLIAAITEFASTVYADSGGELRMLDMGSSNVLLRGSAQVIVAAEFGGEVSARKEQRLDQAFLSIVEQHAAEGDAYSADKMGEALEGALAEPPAKPASKTPIVVVALVAAALAIWAAFDPTLRWFREHRIRSNFAEAMQAHGVALADFPMRLEIDHDDRRVVLRGLAADETAPQAIVDAIAPAALPYRIDRDVKVVVLAPQAAGLAADGERAGQQLSALQSALTQTTAALDALRAQADGPSARLRRLAQDTAIFFAEQAAFANEATAMDDIDRLAELLKQTGEALRIVGYADATGKPEANRFVSQARAEKVIDLLVERGVARDKLALVARAASAPEIGAAPLARRVVFEFPYAREIGAR